MEFSIFMDKAIVPTDKDLDENLGYTFGIWKDLQKFVKEMYPDAVEEWNFPGKKYGWSFRMKDKKRAIIYFLPRENSFMAAFVFGQKAIDQIVESDIDKDIVTELLNAKKYAEGRGIRIDVKDMKNVNDIKKLVEIKLAN